MKDYTYKKDKDFILSYEVVEDKIVINYASGKKYETIYTKELEKDILEKMKNQVINYSAKMEEKKSKKKFNNIINLIISVGIIIFTLSVLNISSLYSYLVAISLCEITYAFPKFIRNSKIADYEKNKLFIDNIELFQNGIKEDMGIYKNIDRESKRVIEEVIENNKVLNDDNIKRPNINSIDDISYKSLENIYELLEKNEEFSKYYNNSEVSSKRKVLKK